MNPDRAEIRPLSETFKYPKPNDHLPRWLRVPASVGFITAIAALGSTDYHVAEAAGPCIVGLNVRAVTFEDSFEKTGKGRPGIFDGPNIDKEIGPATGFIVYAVDKRDGSILGSTSIGPNGKGTIRGINRECNTKGPNGRDALEWHIYTDQSPQHKMSVVAENNFAADVVVGREQDKAQAQRVAKAEVREDKKEGFQYGMPDLGGVGGAVGWLPALLAGLALLTNRPDTRLQNLRLNRPRTRLGNTIAWPYREIRYRFGPLRTHNQGLANGTIPAGTPPPNRGFQGPWRA